MSRRKARELAMQALYQWQLNHTEPTVLIEQFIESNDMQHVDANYFKEMVAEAIRHTSALDEIISPKLDRAITRLDPVELAILRLSVFEMRDRLDIPYRVIIHEAVELAKQYGADSGYKFVNAVLDKLVSELRKEESK